MITPEPDTQALRNAFRLARLERLFPTPLSALAHPIFGRVLQAAYKHVVNAERRRAA